MGEAAVDDVMANARATITGMATARLVAVLSRLQEQSR